MNGAATLRKKWLEKETGCTVKSDGEIIQSILPAVCTIDESHAVNIALPPFPIIGILTLA